MRVTAVYAKEFARQIVKKERESIEKLLDLLDILDEKEIPAVIDEEGLYADIQFAEWVYSRDKEEWNDLKRELVIKISRCRHVDEEEIEENLKNAGKNLPEKIIGISYEEKEFYACTIARFYTALRKYLAKESRYEFEKDMSFCYPDIYFDKSAGPSMGTLNRDFHEMREEIADHLTALNDYQPAFLRLVNEQKGYQEIADIFKQDTHIECSPQAGRDRVNLLKRKYLSDKTGENTEITCEMHTKFKKWNRDRTKQDRIYFAPGRPDILQGKVIVIHIGEHL